MSIHRAGLVHRDLSPGNLLLDSAPVERGEGTHLIAADETLLVADLGMCKDLALNSGLTVAGGTSGFRPPEQAVAGVVDARADIWAMSALVRWVARDAGLPAALRAVIERGLADLPDDRQPDAATWLAEVEEALAPPPPAPPVAPDPPAPAPAEPAAAKATRRRRWLTPALAAIALAVGVGTAAVFTAVAEGVEGWTWSLPTGTTVIDTEEVTITATSPGAAEIILRSRLPNGDELEARHTIRVVS